MLQHESRRLESQIHRYESPAEFQINTVNHFKGFRPQTKTLELVSTFTYSLISQVQAKLTSHYKHESSYP